MQTNTYRYHRKLKYISWPELPAFASCLSVNQVDYLPAALNKSNKDAGWACRLFPGRAGDHIFYKQMYTVGENIDEKLPANQQEADSSYIKASIACTKFSFLTRSKLFVEW